MEKNIELPVASRLALPGVNRQMVLNQLSVIKGGSSETTPEHEKGPVLIHGTCADLATHGQDWAAYHICVHLIFDILH